MNTLPIEIIDVKPEAADFPTFVPEQLVERVYRDALAYLVFKWPLFAQLIYSSLEIEYTIHPAVPVAATDARSIFINPDGFVRAEITDVLEIVFVEAHEVYHYILYDIVMSATWIITMKVHIGNGEELPYDHDLMGRAMDYRINASLVDSKIGRMPKCGLYDPSLSEKGFESCVEIYVKLWQRHGGMKGYKEREKERKAGNKIGRYGGTGRLGDGFDRHMAPRPGQVEAQRGKREQAIIAAAEIAQRTVPGSVPAMLKRILDDIVNPKVPWDRHLRAMMQRKAGQPRLDWRRHNRRLASREDPMYFATKGHIGAGIIVAIGDNSGSITAKVANVFGSEMLGIVKDLNPVKLIVIWCDAAITRIDEVDEPQDLDGLFADWRTAGIGGGGGTDFRPPFEKIKEMGIVPDMVVYLTDMEGRFPTEEPPYPVIWGSIKSNKKAPFGEIVHVEI
jgi:predicted metal-dependent peptidase